MTPPRYTPHQSKAIACLLTRAGAEDDALAQSLSAAKVDLNPHQVDAALFALRSPLSKGVILADEVGLGKTIEAALVLAQRWWEGRRRLLLIVPASLRKQWAQELREKFSLKSIILDAKRVKELQKAGQPRPFERTDAIVILSYEYAARIADDLRRIAWDMVVFDEAHKLRNVYKAATTARAALLRDALKDRPKLLLTATPLQNNLMELYGLVSVLDEHFFGSPEGFKAEFSGRSDEASLAILGSRLQPICKRTLRRQVQKAGLINYTNRIARTFDFTPSQLEEDLYERVSDYLRDPNTLAVGKNGRHLVTLVLHRILGSSSFAIAGTLQKMIDRLERQLTVDEETLDDLDGIEDHIEEYRDAGDSAADALEDEGDDSLAGADALQLRGEIAMLCAFRDLANSIAGDHKGCALVDCLPRVLDEIERRKGRRKAVIFTESVRTQTYLRNLLAQNGYGGQIAILNGSNADPESQAIYKAWLAKHAGTETVSGSKTADMKQAIVEAFRDDKTILIATESGAEGINLQFCSLLINYDLPWNPQRVEQRIGRCHRYGQKIDVTVVNFLNRKNAAEERVFALLNDKFKLFDGVFGASDEVLGAIESGVDIERRIHEIVQSCRTADEINAAFDRLQSEFAVEIDAAKREARERVLAAMDDKVIQRLHVAKDAVEAQLDDYRRWLLILARAELPEARFHDGHAQRFDYQGKTWTTEWPIAVQEDWQFFRLAEGTLAHELVDRAVKRALPEAHIEFDLDAYAGNIAAAEPLRGRSGWMRAVRINLLTPAKSYDDVIFAGVTDDGLPVDAEIMQRLMLAPARDKGPAERPPAAALAEIVDQAATQVTTEAKARLGGYLEEETEKLDRWRADAEVSFDERIKKLQKEANEKTKQSKLASGLDEKLALQREAAALKREADALKKAYYERLAEIDAERERLLDEVAARLDLIPSLEPLFTIRWSVRGTAQV